MSWFGCIALYRATRHRPLTASSRPRWFSPTTSNPRGLNGFWSVGSSQDLWSSALAAFPVDWFRPLGHLLHSIPPAQQRLIFEAETRGTDLRWVLNGQDLGPPLAHCSGSPSLDIMPSRSSMGGARPWIRCRLWRVGQRDFPHPSPLPVGEGAEVGGTRSSTMGSRSGMRLTCSSQAVASLSLGAR